MTNFQFSDGYNFPEEHEDRVKNEEDEVEGKNISNMRKVNR